MDKKAWACLAIGVGIGLVFAPQLRKIPVVKNIPTI